VQKDNLSFFVVKAAWLYLMAVFSSA